MTGRSAERTAAVQMVLCTFLWGAFFVVGKIAVAEAGPLAAAALRFVVASGALLLLLAWREPAAYRLRGRDLLLALALGASGVALYNALAFWGFARSPAADGAMISPSLNPVVTALLAAPLLGERLGRDKLLGVGVALCGVVLVFAGPLAAEAMTRERLTGDVFFALSALTWSGYTMLGRLAVGRFSSLASTTYASVAGMLLLLPFAAGELSALRWSELTVRFWLAIGFLALFCTIAAFLLWYGAIRRIGASRTASYLPLVPIWGVAQSIAVLGDRPTALQYVGMALGAAGVWWANRTRPANLPR